MENKNNDDFIAENFAIVVKQMDEAKKENEAWRMAYEKLYCLVGQAIYHAREAGDDAFASYLIVRRGEINEEVKKFKKMF